MLDELFDYIDDGRLKETIENSIVDFKTDELEHYMLYDLGLPKEESRKAIAYLLELLSIYNAHNVDEVEENVSIAIRNIITMLF